MFLSVKSINLHDKPIQIMSNIYILHDIFFNSHFLTNNLKSIYMTNYLSNQSEYMTNSNQ